jgi:hypothetical protein
MPFLIAVDCAVFKLLHFKNFKRLKSIARHWLIDDKTWAFYLKTSNNTVTAACIS